jgi:hypothetical protein
MGVFLAFSGCSRAARVLCLRGRRGAWAVAGRPTVVVGVLFVGSFLLPSAKGVGVGNRKVSNVDRRGGWEKGSNIVFFKKIDSVMIGFECQTEH